MNADPRKSIVFCATIRQTPQIYPPFDQVLLLQDGDEPWRFPHVGEFEYAGKLKDWTDGALLAPVEAPFKPSEVPGRRFQWLSISFAVDCLPTFFAPGVMGALRRFGGPLIDQVLARVEAFADSNSGDSKMSTSIQDLQKQLEALKRQVGAPLEERAKFVEAQSRAAQIYTAFNDSAPAFVNTERLQEYRARLLRPLQKHSRVYKDSDLAQVSDPVAFAAIEDAIYQDAAQEIRHPSTSLRPGELRSVVERDQTGRPITRFFGDPMACWRAFTPPARYAKILVPGVTR